MERNCPSSSLHNHAIMQRERWALCYGLAAGAPLHYRVRMGSPRAWGPLGMCSLGLVDHPAPTPSWSPFEKESLADPCFYSHHLPRLWPAFPITYITRAGFNIRHKFRAFRILFWKSYGHINKCLKTHMVAGEIPKVWGSGHPMIIHIWHILSPSLQPAETDKVVPISRYYVNLLICIV